VVFFWLTLFFFLKEKGENINAGFQQSVSKRKGCEYTCWILIERFKKKFIGKSGK
jgi:hypothetical protein